ncbi:MAG TPA: dCTP deaminase [Steroidobacteraceae bacterium]|nr:dCTP deaminase [Steroidobacteraceae bacterium]
MILSNVEIVRCLGEKYFEIEPLAGTDPSQPPFNTSAVDLRLGDEILVPDSHSPVQLDLRKPGIAPFWAKHSKTHTITDDRPYSLVPNKLILAKTLERVNFPLLNSGTCFSARVEGKSSLARCGILVHFTAPTIHAGFSGTITLEIINLGTFDFLLSPGMFVCQLIIEEVRGTPASAPNQFKGQSRAAGVY